jgi:hypothetical protein
VRGRFPTGVPGKLALVHPSVAVVARAIVRLGRRPRREVTIGSAGRGALLARRLVPGLTERVTGRIVRRSHFREQPAAISDGNLYEPIADLAVTAGGWRRR